MPSNYTNIKTRLYILSICLFIANALWATVSPSIPLATYYASAQGKTGRDLELALTAIVSPYSKNPYNNQSYTKLAYDDLWTAYKTTDPGPTDSIPAGETKTDLVYDMYAWMKQFPKYYSDNDHSQTSGINREHCVPNSWWGAEAGNAIAYTDLHHLVPSDGAANNAKSNYALGEYKSGMTLVWPTSTKTNSSSKTYVVADSHSHTEGGHCYANASHVWKPTAASQYGGSAQLFEPADEYKGDFARMYLYVVCAYEGHITWQTNYMFTSDASNYTTINTWALNLLLKWHRQDPVSEKELLRNNAVYSLQNNRNPFIDYPEFVEYIWGNKSTTALPAVSSLTSAYDGSYSPVVTPSYTGFVTECAAPVQYAITFNDNVQSTSGYTPYEIQVTQGQTFTFPTLSDVSVSAAQKTSGTCQEQHYHFIGWVLEAQKDSPTDSNVKKGGSTSDAVSAAAVYYAVWAKEQ